MENVVLLLPFFVAFSLFILSYPQLGLIFIAFFTPISPLITVGRTAVRDITIRVDDVVAVLVLLAWVARGFRLNFSELVFEREARRVFRFLFAFFSVYVISYLINLGHMGLFHTFTLIKYTQYWLGFVFALAFGGAVIARTVIWAFLVASSLACAFWLYKIVFLGAIGNQLHFPFHTTYGGRENVGIFSLGILSLSLSLFFFYSTALQRFFLGALGFGALIVWARTLSRASYLGAMAWSLSFLFISKRREVLIFFILALTLFPFLAPDYFVERVKYTFRGLGGGEILGVIYVESSVFVRLGRWKYFLAEQFPHKPFLGFGPFGLGLMDSQYMRVLAEVGIVGFLIFLMILWSLLTAFLKVFRETTGFHKAFALALLTWLFAIFMHMIPANTFVLLQTSQIFWLFAGLLLSPRKDEKEIVLK